MDRYRVLVIDDNYKICNLIRKFGEQKFKYKIDTVHNINDALSRIINNYYDLITLDINLKYEDGLVEIERIRSVFDGPIIFVSGINKIDTILEGFKKGADDYVTKPFDLNELFVRINRSIERSKHYRIIKIGNYTINEYECTVSKDNQVLNLSKIATKILMLLLLNENEILSRQTIFEEVWAADYSFSTRVIDTHISYIRKEINDSRLRSIRMQGYMFELANSQ